MYKLYIEKITHPVTVLLNSGNQYLYLGNWNSGHIYNGGEAILYENIYYHAAPGTNTDHLPTNGAPWLPFTTECTIIPSESIWQLVDLGDDKPAMNYQANNIAELKDRQVNYSQALKVPRTKNNCALFGFSDSFDVVTNFPYQKHNCRLFSNDSVLAGPGSYLILDKVNKFFEVQILSGNVDFFDILKNKSMSELDLGYVEFGKDGVTNHSYTSGTYYRYCLCTTVKGGYNAVSHFEEHSYPFVYLLKAIEQIVKQNGYEAFNHNIFEPVRIKHGISICSLTPFGDSMAAFEAAQGYINFEYGGGSVSYSGILVDGGNGTFVKFDQTSFKLTALINGAINLDITKALLSGALPTADVIITIVNETTGDTLHTIDNLNMETVNVQVDVNKGDVIKMTLNAYSPNTGSLRVTFKVTEYVTEQIPIGAKLYLAPNLGFDTQFDFFKAFVQMFGLTVNVDNDTKIVDAYTMNKLHENKPDAKDWSAKLHDVETDTNFTINGYAQNNYIKLEDNQDDNVTDKGNIVVANNTLENWKDLFVSKFQAGLNNATADGIVANIPLEEMTIDDNGLKQFNFVGCKPHLVLITQEILFPSMSSKYYVVHQNASQYITNYYPELQDMLTNAKWKEDEFFLTEQDIAEFNSFVPVYIQKRGAYFYVNKIKNFVSGKLTKCEIVRL